MISYLVETKTENKTEIVGEKVFQIKTEIEKKQ